MIELKFDKLYRYPRKEEHAFIAIPLKKGKLKDISKVAILSDGNPVPMQGRVTSYHEDGSIRYLFLRFMAELPGNAKTSLMCNLCSDKISTYEGIQIKRNNDITTLDCDGITFSVRDYSKNIIEYLEAGEKKYFASQFEGPYLKDGDDNHFDMELGEWRIVESGPVCAVLSAKGVNKGKRSIEFEVKITAYAKKPWIEISYRIINTSDDPLHIASLVFHLKADQNNSMDDLLEVISQDSCDSTGCGDIPINQDYKDGLVFHTVGIKDLERIEEETPVSMIRTCVGSSNYKTDFLIAKNGTAVNKIVDAKYLVGEANEHYAEVFYGTFFTDRTDEFGGVCATIFQAQQNYPKAVKADKNGISVMLVPENVDKVVMQSGMSREQKFLLHFHSPNETLKEIDNRSLIYQMPDRPTIAPSVYKEADVMLDVFVENIDTDVEASLIFKADEHARCYGMLNWGDAPDQGYTLQGRGKGAAVWTNNEYDYPHACALQYARTGIRRFFDYMMIAGSHWMDVDVCHYSKDSLKIGGQIEHCAGHTVGQMIVPSHEWVEGLLDYYHFTGDERAYETALGIGENILKLLETPMFQKTGESNARETGWALRSLTALYVETHDEKWTAKSKWIINHFKQWEETYGAWLAPYTDNTTIRVPFMISVAAGSLMRYYRVFKDQEIKDMILRAVDDVIENCYLDMGLFYYKELPSLSRLGNNTLLLEALAIAYELTGDKKYLSYGEKTFYGSLSGKSSFGSQKRIEGDAVIVSGNGTKNFAQSFIPLVSYYKAIRD